MVGGFGGMGDALVCIKCGRDKYPEAFGLYWRRLPSTPLNIELAQQARERAERIEKGSDPCDVPADS